MSAETRKKSQGKLGWLPSVAAILAFIACNGLSIILLILSFFGIIVTVSPSIQAVVISLFSVLTLIFVFLNYRKNYALGALILSFAGVVLVVGTMYVSFNKLVESLGLLALIASAVWSRSASKGCVDKMGVSKDAE